MANSNQSAPPGNADRSRGKESATLAMRVAFFALTIVPLGALLLPWVTLDGTQETHTGVETIALPAAPIGEYMFEVTPLQAATLILGTALIALLAIMTAYRYHRRKSIYWAPLAMLVLALAVALGTDKLVNATHSGLSIVMATATLLIIHQALIRLQVSLRRKSKLPKVYRSLAIVTGSGYYRWSDA